MAAFLRYLDVKRQNAVWGDDPEVQALCEIYDRPAEIWAYDSQVQRFLFHRNTTNSKAIVCPVYWARTGAPRGRDRCRSFSWVVRLVSYGTFVCFALSLLCYAMLCYDALRGSSRLVRLVAASALCLHSTRDQSMIDDTFLSAGARQSCIQAKRPVRTRRQQP